MNVSHFSKYKYTKPRPRQHRGPTFYDDSPQTQIWFSLNRGYVGVHIETYDKHYAAFGKTQEAALDKLTKIVTNSDVGYVNYIKFCLLVERRSCG